MSSSTGISKSNRSSSPSGSRLSLRIRALRRTRTLIPALLIAVAAALIAGVLLVQAANQTWSGGASGNGTAWYTVTNWVGGAAFPGSQATTTNTDIASIGSTGTNPGLGINGTTSATLFLGAIDFSSASRVIGDSAAGSLTLTLNGAAVNSVNNVIIRDSVAGTLTLQPQNGGAGTMSVALGNATDNLINIDGAGGVTISSIIKNGTGNHITLGGGGAGSLTLSGASTYTGGTTINSAKAVATVNSALGAGNVNVNTTGVGLTLQGAFNNYIADTATVNIATGAMMALNQTGGSDTIGGLVLGGVTQTTPGTYGSSASGAANQFDSFFTGTGTLTLVGGPTNPSGVGAASPSTVAAGGSTLLTVTVTPGTNPASTGLTVTGDLSTIGGSATQTFFDNGTNGDVTPGDNVFSFQATVSNATTNGSKSLPITINDAQARNGSTSISLTVATTTAIHTIQGSGTTSPMVGQVVTTTGIVTARIGNGFFIQAADTDVDADPNSSEGIFVFTSSAPTAAATVGNAVVVTGTVQEFTPSGSFSRSQTELSGSPSYSVASTGNPLPTPIILAAADSQVNNYNNLNKYENMRVHVNSLTAVSGTQGTVTESSATSVSNGIFYGVITGIARPFREPGIAKGLPTPTPYPSGAAPASAPQFDFNPERLRLNTVIQSGSTALNVVSGQVITNITGVLDYFSDTFTIDTDPSPVPAVSGNSNAVPVPTPTATEMTIASFNMERFFDTTDDPATSDVVLTATAFNNRLNKASLAIRNVLRYPDIVAVEEMEAGRPTSGEPDNLVLQQVATKVNNDAITAGDPNPNYQAYLTRGNDIGGINVGFLVKSPKITVFSVTQDGKSITWNSPTEGANATLNDRPPLILRASIVQPDTSVLPFSVIVVHQRSLSGIEDSTNSGAHVRLKRKTQAEYLATLINEMQFGGARQVMPYDQQIVCVGDFNAFEVNDGYADVMGTVLGAPAPANQVVEASATISTNTFDLLPYAAAGQNYSYSFDGDAQTIDHELVNRSMLARFSRIAYGRMDADFPEAFRNDPNRPERLSDHDPAVAFFNLTLSPTAADGSVTGTITDAGGAPVAGVTINLSGNEPREAITNSAGNYRFDNVETNGFYTVTPSRANYAFSPANRSFSLLGVRTEASFTASANGDNANAIDTTEYFVRQQYLDFLGREPDPPGFMGWVNTINNCAASDASCDRAHVSEMFFRSREFQERGYFAYRFYATAFGRKPDYAEFTPDLARVSGFLTNDQLEAAKTAFVNEFMARPAFAAQYNRLSNSAYVDALVNTAAVNLSNRQAMIDSLNNGTATRAQVLRQIAESGQVYQRFYNQAFVAMEYFGYLRRDPDALYLNWIVVLDANPSDSRRMVEGFVNSPEYRNRFTR